MNGTIDRRLRRLEGNKLVASKETGLRFCFVGRPGHPDPTQEELATCTHVIRFVRPGEVRQ